MEQLLSKQAEYSMLNGDFDHFEEDTAELLPEKEVGSFELVLCLSALCAQFFTEVNI